MSNHLSKRRGRGLRGVTLPQYRAGATIRYVDGPRGNPRWKPRSSQFGVIISDTVKELARSCDGLDEIEFGFEDVPPSDPAPWEDSGVILGRVFPEDEGAHLPLRIVLYRLPIVSRVQSQSELEESVRTILVENIAIGLGISPQDIDPDYFP